MGNYFGLSRFLQDMKILFGKYTLFKFLSKIFIVYQKLHRKSIKSCTVEIHWRKEKKKQITTVIAPGVN